MLRTCDSSKAKIEEARISIFRIMGDFAKIDLPLVHILLQRRHALQPLDIAYLHGP